jgi:thiosulfate/3-mercaptopyruvate sulfurtransferase
MDTFPGPVVEPEWLRTAAEDHSSHVLADVRWVPDGTSRQVFERGHLPGAVLIDADRDLAASPFEGPGRHPLPSPEAFAAAMSRAGIGDGIPVVAYDDARGSIAARLWWMLDAIGHPVVLLDGGLDAWDGPLETGPGRIPESARFTARPWPRDRIVDAEAVQLALANPAAQVVDVRAPERYRGEVEPFDPVAGHIPGARSAPWTDNVDPATGRFLKEAAMRARWTQLGVDDANGVIAHCGSGLTACHSILSMRLAGLGQARLYEGSWSDWVSDPARPVATGDDPHP